MSHRHLVQCDYCRREQEACLYKRTVMTMHGPGEETLPAYPGHWVRLEEVASPEVAYLCGWDCAAEMAAHTAAAKRGGYSLTALEVCRHDEEAARAHRD